MEISPSSPHVLQFDFDNMTTEEDSYELYIETTDNDHKCLYVGINKVGCPWVDSASAVTNSRLWSRMIKTGYFPIKVFTWQIGSKVHVSSTAIHTFLTIKMKRGRNALLFEV